LKGSGRDRKQKGWKKPKNAGREKYRRGVGAYGPASQKTSRGKCCSESKNIMRRGGCALPLERDPHLWKKKL